MAKPPPATAPIAKILRDERMAMRDGTRLSADIYLPQTGEQRHPTILMRTPYGKADETEQAAPLAKYLAVRGFAVVVQDVRGTGASEGVFKPYCDVEGPDGYDTLDWIVRQDWSSGKIGTVGCSYHGEVQDMLAAERHPAHKAAFIEGAYTYNNGGMRAFSFVRYGALELAYAVGGEKDALETLPLARIHERAAGPDTSYYRTRWPDAVHAWMTEPPSSPYWKDDGGLGDTARFDVPAIHMNEWYSLPFSSIRMFELYRNNAASRLAADNQFLILSPMTHCRTSAATEATIVGERDVGDARIDYFGIMIDWFDHWLKGIDNGITEMPRVQAFLMGKNVWQTTDAWPPPGTESTPLYLSGDGLLGVACTPHEQRCDIVYNPTDPVPSLGGPVRAGTVLEAGAFDQREVEARDDVLVFTTHALNTPLQVSGPIEVVLFVSSDCPDTDFTAKLVDVYPDGRAFNLVEGITRMRYRHDVTAPAPMRPGEIYRISIDLDSTSNWFGPGHRIRLEISSSNFPRFDRNLNTGADNAATSEYKIAHNAVHMGGNYRSRLILPIVKGP